MNGLTISWSSVRSFLRQAAAVVGAVVGVANSGHWSTSVQTAIVSISGLLLTAEHYANAINPATAPQSNSAGTATPPTTPGA